MDYTMKQIAIFFVAMVATVNGGLNQLCWLIDEYEHLSYPEECVMYGLYGCWCGPGGSGSPVDGTDRCCHRHDLCYDVIIAKHSLSPYRTQYNYKNKTCTDAVGTMLHDICSCDKALALCLSRNTFNWRYWGERFWPGYCKDTRTKPDTFE